MVWRVPFHTLRPVMYAFQHHSYSIVIEGNGLARTDKQGDSTPVSNVSITRY